MYKSCHFRRSPLCLGVASVLLSCVINAQESATIDIERITVYSGFRDINLAQLDASASVIDARAVSLRQASHFDDILNIAPNVNFATGASRGRFVQIRGIGERSQFSEPINPSVSIIVDGFDFSGLGAAGLLFDTQQVEVFRGPQATLFGGGALAGAIRVQSAAPTQQPEGFVNVQLATESTTRLEAAYSNALNTDSRYRVSILNNKSNGFVENTFLQRDNTNGLDESAAKLHLDVDISANTELSLKYHWYDINNGYDAFSLDNDNQTLSDEPGFDRQRTHAIGMQVQHATTLADVWVNVTHANHDVEYAYDEDWTFTGFHPFGYTSFDSYTRDLSTQTAELRIVGNDDSAIFNNTTTWVAGVFIKRTEENLLREYTFSENDFASQFTPNTHALYLQFQTALSHNWQLETGLRLERFAFDYLHNEGLETDSSTSAVGGKVSLSYAMNDHFLYASISRGYKAAGVNPDQRVSDERRIFDTEYNWNYEVGVKSLFKPLDLTTRLALFHMRRKDTQISDFDVLVRDDGTSDFIDIIDNADLGTNEGIELESNWQATDKFNIAANVGYLNASFEGFTQANGVSVDKKQQAQAPKWTGHISSSYQFTDTIAWNINMDVKDDFRFSDGHDVTAGSTTLVNTELSWESGEMRIALWSKNLFDRIYYTRGFGGFSNDPRDEYAFEEPYFQQGNGRQIGVSVRYQFY